jgi:hypothetical protein
LLTTANRIGADVAAQFGALRSVHGSR